MPLLMLQVAENPDSTATSKLTSGRVLRLQRCSCSMTGSQRLSGSTALGSETVTAAHVRVLLSAARSDTNAAPLSCSVHQLLEVMIHIRCSKGLST